MSKALFLILALVTMSAWGDSDPRYNPKPAPDDIVLPMPCGGSMVFRDVYVLSKGLLDDREITLGYAFNDSEPGYKQSFMSGYRRAYINGQFQLGDLPTAWQQTLSASLPAGESGKPLQPVFYFIGKYEVSEAQYAAVMSQAASLHGEATHSAPVCPDLNGGSARLPKVNLSWFDAQRFGALYSAWLLKFHKELLPMSGRAKGGNDGGMAFVRLPTEAEWEYAARGGQAVSRQELEARLFPRPQAGSDEPGPLSQWAVYNQVAGGTGQAPRLLPIGTRKPNPVGLYDVIGNASEMVQEPFQLVRAGRLQGAYGGFIVKGGNYLEGEMTLFTGMRREYPLFAADGSEQRNEATGFRVALGALSAPRARYDELFTAWQETGRLATLSDEFDSIKDPTKRLEAIIAASPDAKLQSSLTSINEELKRNVALIADQRREAVGNLIQSTALVAETINNYNIRLLNLKRERDKAITGGDTALATRYDATIKNGNSALNGALAIYLDNVATGSRYTDEVMQGEFQRVTAELKRKPVLGSSLTTRATTFMRHVAEYRKNHKLDPERTLKDLE